MSQPYTTGGRTVSKRESVLVSVDRSQCRLVFPVVSVGLGRTEVYSRPKERDGSVYNSYSGTPVSKGMSLVTVRSNKTATRCPFTYRRLDPFVNFVPISPLVVEKNHLGFSI